MHVQSGREQDCGTHDKFQPARESRITALDHTACNDVTSLPLCSGGASTACNVYGHGRIDKALSPKRQTNTRTDNAPAVRNTQEFL